MNSQIAEIGFQLALAGFKIGAIQINPEKPFLWASGTQNPIYNDNRRFLWYPEYRALINSGFRQLFLKYTQDATVIAGTSTAGIPHGYALALDMRFPFVYIRDKPKDHGKRNQIEGLEDDGDFCGEEVVVIEDLFSTGASSVKAVQAVRDANGVVNNCFSIFTYDLPQCSKMFAGLMPFSENKTLIAPCSIYSLLHYSDLIRIGIENDFIKPKHEVTLNSWMEDQSNWGTKNGFPPVKK